MVGGVIHVYVEVVGDEEFMRCGCSGGEKRCEFIQKAEIVTVRRISKSRPRRDIAELSMGWVDPRVGLDQEWVENFCF